MAPDFSLPSSNGVFTLSKDYQGKQCIIYFYPQAYTKVCTKQAQELKKLFQEKKVPIVGISRDNQDAINRFKEEYDLPMVMLSDKEGSVCKQYGALVPVLGKPKRITYLLDQNHRIRMIHQDMLNEASHIQALMQALSSA